MRDGFGMFLVLFLPLVSLYYLAALINPKWFSRSKVTTSRLHIVLSYVLLVLCWVFLVIFASGAGGAWWLVLALIPAYFSARAYHYKPEPKKSESLPHSPVSPPPPIESSPAAIQLQPVISKQEPKAKPKTPRKPRDHRTLPEIAQTIVEDGIVTIEEAKSLRDWFEERDRLKDKRPFGLYQVLCEALKDDELSADESAVLLEKLRAFIPFKKSPHPIEKSEPLQVTHTDDWKGLTIDCTYETATGEVSDRRLKVLTDNGYSIYCYCHMRRAKRTFVKHRVISAVDVDSGEVLV